MPAKHRLGNLDLAILSDGLFYMDAGATFGIVPRVMWEPYAREIDNRHRLSLTETDLPAEKQDWRFGVRLCLAAQRGRQIREAEDADALEKEVALFVEEQIEPREVDLLGVFFDLGEVGVDGHVGREAACHAVFEIESDITGQVVGNAGPRSLIG